MPTEPRVGVDAYLARIGLAAPPAPTLNGLAQLQLAHILHVPFENLSIGWGESIVLEEEWLLDKIVRRRRGGFCYELNGAFAWLLRALGFHVDQVEARVWSAAAGAYGPPFDHMTLIVHVEDAVHGEDAAPGPYLVDVGFGRAPRAPIALPAGTHRGDDGVFRVWIDGGVGRLERLGDAEQWQPEHQFTTLPRRLDEYRAMCAYHQTSPDSHFTQNRVCSLAKPDGRLSLTPREFIRTEGDSRETTPVRDEAHYRQLLLDHFGIRAPDA